MKKTKGFFSRFYLALVLLFFYLPILYVVVFSFNDSKSLTNFTGFSLQWYEVNLHYSAGFPADCEDRYD